MNGFPLVECVETRLYVFRVQCDPKDMPYSFSVQAGSRTEAAKTLHEQLLRVAAVLHNESLEGRTS